MIGQDYQGKFRWETGANLQTPTRGNMSDGRGKDANRWIVSTHRLVETVIGQLTERSNIEKVHARALLARNHSELLERYLRLLLVL